MKKLLNGTLNFLKKWGIYGVLGYITLFIPLGLGYLLGNDNLRTTGLVIAAIVAAPNGVGLLLTVIFAALYKWLWKVAILGFVAWATETILKIQIQNQMMLYYDSEEIQMLLDMGIKIKNFSDKERKLFIEKLKRDRIKMIEDQWSKNLEKIKEE